MLLPVLRDNSLAKAVVVVRITRFTTAKHDPLPSLADRRHLHALVVHIAPVWRRCVAPELQPVCQGPTIEDVQVCVVWRRQVPGIHGTQTHGCLVTNC